MTHIIEIPNWHPTPLNKLIGSKHWQIKNYKQGDMQMIAAYAHKAKVPLATGKRYLQLIITLGRGQRACDPDAYYKSLLDALVTLGYLKDDNRKQLDLAPVQFERANCSATTIKLTDITPYADGAYFERYSAKPTRRGGK